MTHIRVMTFNVFGQPEDYDPERHAKSNQNDPERWARRGALVVRVIRKCAPDVIGFQEVQRGHFDFLRDRLPEYAGEIGLECDEGINAQYNSIFWMADRFELSDSGIFYFSRTSEVRSCDWGVPYPMGASWVRLRDRRSGAEFVHLNTTFEDGPDGERSRVQSAKLIADRTLGVIRDLPLIVTADFNCNPTSAAYELFARNGFSDTFRAAGHSDGSISTYHAFLGSGYNARDSQFGGPNADPYWRVDWILTRDGRHRLRTRSCIVVRDAEPPVYPSDHYPVLAELEIVNRNGEEAA